MWNIIEQRLIQEAYKLRQKPINSIKLLIISSAFLSLSVLFALDLSALFDQSAKADTIMHQYNVVHSTIYLKELLGQNIKMYQIILVSLIFSLEGTFLILIFKNKNSELWLTTLGWVYYCKMTFEMQIVVCLTFVVKNEMLGPLIIFKILAVTALISSVTINFFCSYFNFTCLFKHKNKSDQSINTIGSYCNVVIKIISVLSNIRETSKTETIIFGIVFIAINVILLCKIIQNKFYKFYPILEIVEYLSSIFIICFFLLILFKNIVTLIDDNLFVVFCAIFIWASLSFFNLFEHFKRKLLIKKLAEIKNENEAISFLKLLFQIYETRQKHENSVMLLSLVKDHSCNCTNPSCVCKIILKSNGIDKIEYDKNLLLFGQMNVLAISKEFDSVNIDLVVLGFEVQVMQNYSKYFYYSTFFENRNNKNKLTIAESYSLFEIGCEATNGLRGKNNDNDPLKNGVNMSLFNQEKTNSECFEKVEKISSLLSNFYRHNSRNICGLNFLQKELNLIAELLLEIEIYLEQKEVEILSAEFILLLSFFYRCIVNHTYKTKNLINQLKTISNKLEIGEMKICGYSANLFSENGCVMMCSIDKLSLGKITKVSEQTSKIFKFSNNELMIGVDCNKLIPHCFREQHAKLIDEFINQHSYTGINVLRESFCCDYEENIFQAVVFAQIAINFKEVQICIGVIKKDHKNYMIVNKDNYIDGCGTEMFKFLNEPKNTKIIDVLPEWDQISSRLKLDKNNFPIILRTQIIPKRTIYTAKEIQIERSKSCKDIETFHCTLEVGMKQIGDEHYYSIHKISVSRTPKSVTIEMISEKTPTGNDIKSEIADDDDINKSRSRMSGLINQNVRHEEFIPGSSSSAGVDNQYSIWKIVEELTRRFIEGGNGRFAGLGLATGIICAIFGLLVITQILQVFLFTNGLSSFNQVIYASCAVSDNMQLLEILFNKVIMLEQNCGVDFHMERCEIVKKEAKNVEVVLQQYVTNDIVDLLKNETFYGNRYFEYAVMDTHLINNNQNFEVNILQFMSFFIYSAKQINHLIEKTGKFDDESFEMILDLKMNWEELKAISKRNIEKYKSISLNELEITVVLVIVLGVLSALLITIYALTERWFFEVKRKFISNILQLFRIVSLKTSENLYLYYSELEKVIKSKNFDLISKVDAPKLEGTCSSTLNEYKKFTNHEEKCCLVSIWMISVILIFVLTYLMVNDKIYWKQTAVSINELMASENFALENYFEVKSYFLIDGNFENRKDFLKKIQDRMRRNEVEFVRNAMDTSFLFLETGNELGEIFSELLVGDMCELTKNVTTKWELSQCRQEVSLKMTDSGILSAMAYFERLVFQSLFDLEDDDRSSSEYFKSIDFENMDSYLIFTLRMFQLTQARIIEGNKFTIETKTQRFIIITAVHVTFVFGTLLFWILGKKNKVKEVSLSYGYVLIFPVPLIKESKFIQQTIAKLL